MRMECCIHNLDDVDCSYNIPEKDCDCSCPFYDLCDTEIN
jgi:hypothetical protein